MHAEVRFNILDLEEEYEIAGFKVKGMEQNHPGKSYGYSFEKDGKKIIYATDSECKEDSDEESAPVVDFFRNADLLIFDTQYSLLDAIHTKENWGHSNNMLGVELAVRGNVKHLCMFHSEPTHDDEILDKILKNTEDYASLYDKSYPLKISLAFDGLTIEV